MDPMPPWASEIVNAKLTGVDLSAFTVLKDNPSHKIGVGYTPQGTYLVTYVDGHGQVFRLRRPADVYGEKGARIKCPDCGAAFRFWKKQGVTRVHCFECGTAIDVSDAGNDGGDGGGGGGRFQRKHPRPGQGKPKPKTGRPTVVHPPGDLANPADANTLGLTGGPTGPQAGRPGAGAGDGTDWLKSLRKFKARDAATPISDYGIDEANKRANPEDLDPPEDRPNPQDKDDDFVADPGSQGGDLPLAGVPVHELAGIGDRACEALHRLGIMTAYDLLHADPTDVAEHTGAPVARVKAWQAIAEIRAVPGVGGRDATLLAKAGITGARDLARRRPETLARVLADIAGAHAPAASKVEGWVDAAKGSV